MQPLIGSYSEGEMKARVDELRSKILLVASLARAASERATGLTASDEQLQSLVFMTEDKANEALQSASALLESLISSAA